MAANSCVTRRPPPCYLLLHGGPQDLRAATTMAEHVMFTWPLLGTHLTVHAPSLCFAAFAACLRCPCSAHPCTLDLVTQVLHAACYTS
eukprot:7342265-Alexandrium_andersonii.AAC.1